MITVTNRFKIVKGGMAERMAPKFVEPTGLENFKGFKGIEINICKSFEEYDEMNVMMYWDSLADFEFWRESDHFKASHKRDREQVETDREKQKSPILSNEVIVAELAEKWVI
jgi:heme oxygenase (staphylobilin-producing)